MSASVTQWAGIAFAAAWFVLYLVNGSEASLTRFTVFIAAALVIGAMQ